MQRLGLVLHVSSSHNIIAKAERFPKINETVVDENMKPVGKIFDVFGPVSSPYAAVKPSTREPEKFVGKKLYVLPRREERRGKE